MADITLEVFEQGMRIPRKFIDNGDNTYSESVSADITLDGANTLVLDDDATWDNSAAASTVVNVDVALPDTLQRQAVYLIEIVNPSSVTALNVKVQTKETISAVDHYFDLTSFGVDASGKRAVLVQGWLLGDAGRLAINNVTVLGGADGFTALVRVRKV